MEELAARNLRSTAGSEIHGALRTSKGLAPRSRRSAVGPNPYLAAFVSPGGGSGRSGCWRGPKTSSVESNIADTLAAVVPEDSRCHLKFREGTIKKE